MGCYKSGHKGNRWSDIILVIDTYNEADIFVTYKCKTLNSVNAGNFLGGHGSCKHGNWKIGKVSLTDVIVAIFSRQQIRLVDICLWKSMPDDESIGKGALVADVNS